MNISGIRTSAGFYDYNIIKQNEIRSQRIQEAKAGTSNQEAEEERVETLSVALKEDYGAKNFAERYQPDATYELKGADSDITKLDVEKAISDMKKDSVLEQYQFFVGKSAAQATADSLFDHGGENFML